MFCLMEVPTPGKPRGGPLLTVSALEGISLTIQPRKAGKELTHSHEVALHRRSVPLHWPFGHWCSRAEQLSMAVEIHSLGLRNLRF